MALGRSSRFGWKSNCLSSNLSLRTSRWMHPWNRDSTGKTNRRGVVKCFIATPSKNRLSEQQPTTPDSWKQLFPKDTPSKYVFCPLICATSHSPFLIVTKAITEATRWGVRIIIQAWLWGSVAAAFRAGGVLIPSSACRAFLFPNREGYLNVVAYLRSSKCAHDSRIAQPESAVKSVTYGKKACKW